MSLNQFKVIIGFQLWKIQLVSLVPHNQVILEEIVLLLVEVQMIGEGLFAPMDLEVEEIRVEASPEVGPLAVEDRRGPQHHQMGDHLHL
mgnify:CR=1 FL=1